MSGVQGWKPVEISLPSSQWIALPRGELSLPLKQFSAKCPLRLGLLMIGHICGVQSGLNWPLCLSFCIDCYFGCAWVCFVSTTCRIPGIRRECTPRSNHLTGSCIYEVARQDLVGNFGNHPDRICRDGSPRLTTESSCATSFPLLVEWTFR